MVLVKKIKNDDLQKSYKIVVENKDFIAQYNKELEVLQTKVKIDGFREGKIPLDVVKQKYSANALGGAAETLVNNEVDALIKENNFQLAARPKIDIKSMGEDKDLDFEVLFELLPEVPEIKYNKIKLKKEKIKIQPKDMEDEKKHILRNTAKWNDTTAPSKDGDKVNINFLGKIDDVEFEDGKADNFDLVLGSKSFIDNFEQQLEGKNVGDEVSVKVKFPDDYAKTELAGKNAVFDCKVNAIKTPTFPELTPDFLKKNFNVESIEKLEELISNELNRVYDTNTKNRLRSQVFNWLEKNVKLDIPESLVNNEVVRQVNEKTTEEERKVITEKSRKDLSISLVLSNIAKKQDIKATQEEVVRQIYTNARLYPGQEQVFVDFYTKNEAMLQQISAQVLEDKVVDYIIQNADVEEVELTIDEFLKNK